MFVIHELDDDGASMNGMGRLRCGVRGRIEFRGGRRYLTTPRMKFALSILKPVSGLVPPPAARIEPTTCKACLKFVAR